MYIYICLFMYMHRYIYIYMSKYLNMWMTPYTVQAQLKITLVKTKEAVLRISETLGKRPSQGEALHFDLQDTVCRRSETPVPVV